MGVTSSWGGGEVAVGWGGVAVRIDTLNGKVVCAWMKCIRCKKKKAFDRKKNKRNLQPHTRHLHLSALNSAVGHPHGPGRYLPLP